MVLPVERRVAGRVQEHRVGAGDDQVARAGDEAVEVGVAGARVVLEEDGFGGEVEGIAGGWCTEGDRVEGDAVAAAGHDGAGGDGEENVRVELDGGGGGGGVGIEDQQGRRPSGWRWR